MTPEMRDKWIEANVNFLCDIYGKHNLYQVCVHFSEKTVHMHAITGCITPDGRLAVIFRGMPCTASEIVLFMITAMLI